MNKLDTTTRKLQILLAGTVSTTACDWTVSYRDENRNAPQNLGAVPSATMAGTVSSVTAVDLLSAPSVNTIVRVPERISFKNRDVSTHAVTFRLNDNATTYQYWSPTLLTGESAFYDENQGWYATDASGARKTALGATGQFTTLTVSGNTTLGDAAADSLTINAGVYSAPNIPAFAAYKSATTTNVTGNGALYAYICDTEVFDQGANYNNATGVFTAPVTGRYVFEWACRVTGVSVAANNFQLGLVTSNRNWFPIYVANVLSTSDISYVATALVDMDAADTASPRVQVSGEVADTVDVLGTTLPITYFTGRQVA